MTKDDQVTPPKLLALQKSKWFWYCFECDCGAVCDSQKDTVNGLFEHLKEVGCHYER